MNDKVRPTPKHPIQPLVLDERGVLRFKENKAVAWMAKQIDFNELFRRDFPAEDLEQIAQLIGYSHGGSPSYVKDEVWHAAQAMYESGVSELEARNAYLRDRMAKSGEAVQAAVATLTEIYPDATSA